MEEKKTNNNKHRGLVWPIILILVGSIFLLNNLGIIDNVTWQSIWQFWPLFLIAIGLDGLFRRNEIVGPVFMIGLGSVFLLSNSGLLLWEAWDTLWRLWPLLIIAVGLEIIVGRRSLWISLLSVLIIFGILLGMLWMAGVGITPLGEQPLTSENINQPLGDANRAEIILAPSVGILSLGTLSGSEALIAGEVSTGRGQEVCSDYDIQAHTATYSLRAQNSVPVPARAWDWDLALGGTVPVDLDVSMGVGKIDLDLESVKTPNLNISQGIGEIDVIISERSSTDAEISQAIGSITIRIPQGVAVRLSTSKAISSLQLPSNFEQRGEYYFSPNYETSNERVTLEISQAIGSIMVKYENK